MIGPEAERLVALLKRVGRCHAGEMKRAFAVFFVVVGWVCWCWVCAAQESGLWHATSTTARSITGDATLADAKMAINDSSWFLIAQIRALQPSSDSKRSLRSGRRAGGQLGTAIPAGHPWRKAGSSSQEHALRRS